MHRRPPSKRRRTPTFDAQVIALWVAHQEGRCLAVEGVARVGVAEELGKEHFKDVDQICSRQSSPHTISPRNVPACPPQKEAPPCQQLAEEASCTKHGTPRLIDDVQANRAAPRGAWRLARHGLGGKRRQPAACCVHLVNVWVEDAAHEADRGRLVWVLLGQLYVHLPRAALEWR